MTNETNATPQPSPLAAPMAKGEREALALDAARYRRLRACHWHDGGLCVTNGRSVQLGHDTFSGDRLDAAVDALPPKDAGYRCERCGSDSPCASCEDAINGGRA